MQRNRTRTILGLGAVTAVAAGALWFFGGPDKAAEASAQPATLAAIAPIAPPAAFVPSMQGTIPDGDLRALQSGLALGPPGGLAYAELRRLFDYYLSAVGEQSIAAITQQVNSELDRRLPAPQAKKAQRLFALYIEFKRELVELEAKPDLAGNGVQAIRRRMLAMQDLRSRYFSGDESRGMFGFDDAYDLDAVARLAVSQNPALNDAQKKQQLAALDAAMPANLRSEREASHVVVRVEQQAIELRAKGASEDEIYRMRAKEFDAQAAARLADVDRDEAEWKSRIANYLSERGKLLQSQADVSESERQLALTQLQQSRFTEEERRRLSAYEQ